jgi:hypothetical protein
MEVHMTRKSFAGLCLLPLLGPLAAGGAPGSPSEDAEAKALLQAFVRSGADHAALSRRLRPTPADYEAVFSKELAARLQALYEPAWDQGALVIKGKPAQTEVLVFGASSEDLRSWSPAASTRFPGGWKDVGPHLKPKLRLYAFKFVEPGQSLGMAFDGLCRVNGQWRIFPKAWRALR